MRWQGNIVHEVVAAPICLRVNIYKRKKSWMFQLSKNSVRGEYLQVRNSRDYVQFKSFDKHNVNVLPIGNGKLLSQNVAFVKFS